jgi:polyphosphate kinase 2 (PPK2 family)
MKKEPRGKRAKEGARKDKHKSARKGGDKEAQRSRRKAQAGGEEDYGDTLRALQIELVKLQRDVIQDGERVLVIVEGRDGAGKDGTIKRFVEHMSPRETRVVALGKPDER